MAVTEDRYQKVRVKMWRGDTVPGLSRNAKLLWVYLLTSPDTTMIPGIFSVGIGSIADDLGYTADEVRAALSEITATGEVEFDPAGLVWFRKALDHNSPDAPNNVKGWRRHWSEIKKCALKDVAWTEIRSWLGENRGQTFVQAFDLACPRPTNSKNPQNRTPSPTPSPTGYATPLGTPSGTPYRTQYQEQEQEQEQNTPPPPLGGKAREGAPVCVREDSTPPEPTSAHEPPPSAKTAPCAIRDDEDDPTGPMTSRGASLPPLRATAPTSAPVVVLAPEPCPAPPPASPAVVPAPVESETPRPPSAPAEAPSGQLALVADATKAPAATTRKRRKAAPVADEADVVAVFEFWRETVWKSRAILNEERRNRIAARLAEGFSVDDMKQAARGVLKDDNLMGRRPDSRAGGYRDIETVFRDAAQVERLMQLAPAPRPATPTPAPRREPPPFLGPADPVAAQKMVADYLAGRLGAQSDLTREQHAANLRAAFLPPPSPRPSPLPAAVAAEGVAHA